MLPAVLLTLVVGQSSDGRPPGLEVTGVGEVKVVPDALEIDLGAAGTAELSADAIVKFRDVKRRAREALAKLKVPNLSVAERGVSVTSGDSGERYQRMMRGMDSGPTGKTKVTVGGTLQLRVTGIQGMDPEKLLDLTSKLLDTARDGGTTPGASADEVAQAYYYGRPASGGMVRFVVSDVAAVQRQATKKAVEHAREKAEHLAALQGLTLGRVQSVSEGSAQAANTPYYSPPRGPEGAAELKIGGDRFGEVPVVARVTVRFAVSPKLTITTAPTPPATAERKGGGR